MIRIDHQLDKIQNLLEDKSGHVCEISCRFGWDRKISTQMCTMPLHELEHWNYWEGKHSRLHLTLFSDRGCNVTSVSLSCSHSLGIKTNLPVLSRFGKYSVKAMRQLLVHLYSVTFILVHLLVKEISGVNWSVRTLIKFVGCSGSSE